MLGVEVGGQTLTDRAAFPRITSPISDATEAKAVSGLMEEEATYTGYNSISETDLEQLAQGIVHEVKLRGPFVSLSHFVNRTVGGHAIKKRKLPFKDPEQRIYETDKEKTTAANAAYIYRKGPLQAAIDGESDAAKATDFKLNSGHYVDEAYIYTEAEAAEIAEDENKAERDYGALIGQSLVSHYTGYVTQADILSRIGAFIAPRSDTFKIRAYGDVRDPVTGSATAKSWCELTVQRRAAYVDETNLSYESGRSTLTNKNIEYGRRFEVVAMRWLTEDEI